MFSHFFSDKGDKTPYYTDYLYLTIPHFHIPHNTAPCVSWVLQSIHAREIEDNSPLRISPKMDLVCPVKFCISIVFNFSWDPLGRL